MAKFVRSTGRTDKGINWDLHTLPSNQFYGAGIRRWDGNEYFYGLMNNGARVFGLYHWGTGQSCFGRNNNNKRNGYNLYIYPTKNNSNDYFLGNWTDGKKNGRGLYLFANGSFYYGDWVNDQKHGLILYYNATDGYAYYQTFRNNERVTSEKIAYYFGFPTQLANQTLRPINLPYSQMEYSYEHNTKSDYEFNGTVYNGYWDGFGCLEWNGSMFMGEYYQGTRGTGAYFYTNGGAYFGQLYNCNSHGFGTVFYSNNEYFLGRFVNGKRNGLGFYIYKDGKCLLCNYVNDQADGLGIVIYPNNLITAESFKNHKYVNTLYSYTSSSTTPTRSTTPVKPTTTTTTKTTTPPRTTTTSTKTTKPKRRKTFSELGVKNPYDLYHNLIGQLSVLNVFDDVIDEVESDGKRHNMVFIGNSGTGKSYLAEIYSGILYGNELAKGVHAVELDIEKALRSSGGSELVNNAFKDAKNGVLVINNATCLNAFTTFKRSDISLIKDVLDKNLNSIASTSVIFTCFNSEENDLNVVINNFSKNIDYRVNFEDFDEDELKEMAEALISEKGYKIESEALDLAVSKVERNRGYRSFANAKDLINLINQAIDNCKQRCMYDYDEDDEEYTLIIEDDLFRIIL